MRVPNLKVDLLPLLDWFVQPGWVGWAAILALSACSDGGGSLKFPLPPTNWDAAVGGPADRGPADGGPDGGATGTDEYTGSWTWRACGTVPPAPDPLTLSAIDIAFGLGGKVLLEARSDSAILSHSLEEVRPRVLKEPD